MVSLLVGPTRAVNLNKAVTSMEDVAECMGVSYKNNSLCSTFMFELVPKY